jgi:hypothetical protein
MAAQFQKSVRTWLWLAVMICCVTGSASAIPNPISEVGSMSKMVVQKAFDGTKSVTKESARVVKDVGSTAWTATDSLVSHVRSAF